MPIDRPTFATTLMRRGYDMQQVDLAVEMILENLSLPRPRIGPGDLVDLHFTTVSYRLGYDMEQVDDWLDDVSAELAQRTGEPVPDDAPAAPPDALSAAATTAYPPATRSDAIVEVTSSSPRVLLVLGTLVVLAVLAYVALA